MRTPLAWKNLTHNRVRTAVAVAGVTFAVVLIFMQLGPQATYWERAIQGGFILLAVLVDHLARRREVAE